MVNLLLLGALAASAPTAAALPPKAQEDAKCLTMLLMAAAEAKDDQQKMKTVAAETWYFLGRLDSAVPGQDLRALLPGIAEALPKDPHLKKLGEECDKSFVGRAADLRSLGDQAEKPKP